MAKKKAKKQMRKKVSKPAAKQVKKVQGAPIQPLFDRVLIRREEAEEKKSLSGIVLPDSAQKEKSKIGTVIAVGPGRVDSNGALVAMTVEPGMRVIFNKGWGENDVHMDDDKEYFVVSETEILAIVNK